MFRRWVIYDVKGGGRDEFHVVRGTIMGGFNDLFVPTL